jgi:hypothetical protein
MSTFSRNLPVIALAVAVAVALYVLYQRSEALSYRIELLADDTRHILEYIEQLSGEPKDGQSRASGDAIGCADPLQNSVGSAHEDGSEAEPGSSNAEIRSVDDEDIDVVDDGLDAQVQGPAPLPSSIERYLQDSAIAASDPSPPASEQDTRELASQAGAFVVDDYVHAAPEHSMPGADDDRASVASGSTATTLASSNHKPPVPAKNFPLGHRHLHSNGRMFEVIKTKNGQIRWGAPRKPAPQPTEPEISLS